VRTDVRLLRRLLQNLLTNACRYTPKGKVLFGVHRRGNFAEIQVVDTGIGIPKDKFDEIFAEFRRLADLAGGSKGYGLGLSIVRRISRLLDHPVEVRSQVGKGSVFLVRVPLAETAAQPRPAQPLRQPRHTTIDGVRVLVIDNEKRLAAGLKKGLEAEGFATDVALTGTDGLWMARENPYDAIVLDIMLPGINGYQICATLRDEKNWTPILMLTAKDGELDEAEALDTGADDYLTKPFSFVVLLARLRALLRRGAPQRPAVLRAGDLLLDPSRRRVLRGDVEVELTPREMALLEFLLRHEGGVVSKREIIDHVWDYDFDGDPNIVEVYVRHLRNKLDRPFGRCTIHTVRGAGYRLADDGG
jgi:DNA-binding response OmpR family regulator/anti-sigma regulatory factor (Ser/Thr protein kinase)